MAPPSTETTELHGKPEVSYRFPAVLLGQQNEASLLLLWYSILKAHARGNFAEDGVPAEIGTLP